MLILCIHDVVTSGPRSPWAIGMGQLESVLDRYQRRGYRFCTLDDAPETTGRAIALTADDGRSGAIAWLLNRAPRLGITGTAFIVPGWIDCPQIMPDAEQYSEIATWSQVDALLESGHVIGSHGQTHVRLGCLPAECITGELTQSRTRIAAMTGISPKHFAAPYGHVSEAVIQVAREAGYTTISTTRPGVNSPDDIESGILRRVVLRSDRPALGLGIAETETS